MEEHKPFYKRLVHLPIWEKIWLGSNLGAVLAIAFLGFFELIAPWYIWLAICVFSMIQGIIFFVAAIVAKLRGLRSIGLATLAFGQFIMVLLAALYCYSQWQGDEMKKAVLEADPNAR